MGRKQRGLSLIELLIVVGIILIIAAIAIPNFIRAKISANEASAVTSMHAVATSEIGYSSVYPQVGFSSNLSDLGPGAANTCTPTAACFLDATLASGKKSGYMFAYVGDGQTPSMAYALQANPQYYGLSGQVSYYADETNAIHYNPTSTAGPSDPTL